MADNNDKADAEERDHKTDQAIEAAREEGRQEERERAERIVLEESEFEGVEELPVEDSVPPAPPQQFFQRHEFNNMPGVALIVPDGTPPAEMIRIAATVCEEISLLMLRKTNNALMAALLQ